MPVYVAAVERILMRLVASWRIKIIEQNHPSLFRYARDTGFLPFFGQYAIFSGIYAHAALNVPSKPPSYTANNNTMNSKIYQSLSKALLLSGALFLGWAAHAQSSNTDNTPAASTNHKS